MSQRWQLYPIKASKTQIGRLFSRLWSGYGLHVVLVLGFLLGLAVFLRLWQVQSRPGLEYDEPVYYSVATNLLVHDDLATKLPFGVNEHYLYHPPFYFYLLSGWLSVVGDTLGAARILAATMSILMCALVGLLVGRQMGILGGILALLLAGTDGWLVYTNRIAIIENTMLPIAVIGLIVYQSAFYGEMTPKRRLVLFALAGSIVAFAGVFKHTGLYMLLIFPIHWFLTRRYTTGHIVVMVFAGLVVLAYLGVMTLTYQMEFIQPLIVQIQRTIGGYSSRGVVSTADLIAAAIGTYSIFVGTILATGLGLGIVGLNLFRAFRQRSLAGLRGPHSLYLAWALAALLFFGVIKLKFPQYYIMIFLPVYCYLAAQLVTFFRNNPALWRKRLAALAGVILCLNLTTFVIRFGLHDDNAIGDVAAFASESLPPDSLVLADEPIGTIIPQTYLRTERWVLGMDKVHPDYIITYTTQTQQLPPDPDLLNLIAESRQIYKVVGFKETITVYQLPSVRVGRTTGGARDDHFQSTQLLPCID